MLAPARLALVLAASLTAPQVLAQGRVPTTGPHPGDLATTLTDLRDAGARLHAFGYVEQADRVRALVREIEESRAPKHLDALSLVLAAYEHTGDQGAQERTEFLMELDRSGSALGPGPALSANDLDGLIRGAARIHMGRGNDAAAARCHAFATEVAPTVLVGDLELFDRAQRVSILRAGAAYCESAGRVRDAEALRYLTHFGERQLAGADTAPLGPPPFGLDMRGYSILLQEASIHATQSGAADVGRGMAKLCNFYWDREDTREDGFDVGVGFVDEEPELAALQARIAELEAAIAELQEELTRLRR